jgi:hypothetical protein
MRSGTEKKPNPREVSLAKFFRGLERHVGKGYLQLPNGQILRNFVRPGRKANA